MTRRFPLPLMLTLLFGLLLVGLHGLHQNALPVSRPLPPLPRAVVVLLPGVDVRDIRDTQNAPILARLAENYPAALFSVPPLLRAKNQALSPNERLQMARDLLGLPIGANAQTQIITLDAVFRADTNAPLCLPDAAQKARQNALRSVDAAVSALTNETAANPDRPDAVFFISPIASPAHGAANARMGWVLLWTPQSKTGLLLTSPASRHRPGLVALADMGATLGGANGRALETVTVQNSGASWAAQTDKWAAQWQKTRALVAVPWVLCGLLIAAFWLRHRRTISAFCALFACALPASLWLAALLPPFFGASDTGDTVAFYVFAVLFAGVAVAVGARQKADTARVLQGCAGITAGVFAIDTALGGPLLSRSPLSFSPLEGARLYGAGNEAAGIFLGAGLVFALLCGPRTGFWVRLGLGFIAVFVLGFPTLGANAGATAAALAGWGTLLVMGFPTPRRKIAAVSALACGVILLAALAFWEARRPPSSQTHIGQVLSRRTIRGGKSAGAANIARRKIAMNAHLAVSSPWAILLLCEGGLCAVLLWRGKKNAQTEPWHGGALALFAGASAAFFANDSGVVMASAALVFAPPLLLIRPEKFGAMLDNKFAAR